LSGVFAGIDDATDHCMKAKKSIATMVGAIALTTALVGCSGEPLSNREKGTFIGTGVGAAGGAVVGAAVGAPLAGAAIGGVAGGATGYAVGNHIQNERNGD
jgi:osmotically inducible lipoprotein OsmB